MFICYYGNVCQWSDSYWDLFFARADETHYQANDDAIECQMKVSNIFFGNYNNMNFLLKSYLLFLSATLFLEIFFLNTRQKNGQCPYYTVLLM